MPIVIRQKVTQPPPPTRTLGRLSPLEFANRSKIIVADEKLATRLQQTQGIQSLRNHRAVHGGGFQQEFDEGAARIAREAERPVVQLGSGTGH